MNVTTRIQGIPATVRVIHAKHSAPDPRADNDIDYYGGWELEYDICDRNGRSAPWLENKMTQQDRDRVEADILESLGEPA